MNRVQFEKFRNKVEEITKIINENCYTDSNLYDFISFTNFVKKDIFSYITKHPKYYSEVIFPLLENIKEILKEKKNEMSSYIKNSLNPGIAIVQLMKERAIWLIEEVALDDDEIKQSYLGVVKDFDNNSVGNGYLKKKVVAVDPDDNSVTYENAYQASQSLCIHSGSIIKCCRKIENRFRCRSKKNGKIYRFHYEGEELSEHPKTKRKTNPNKIDNLLKLYA